MPLVATRGAASAQGFGEFAQSGPVNYIEEVFSTWLYTGNGSTQTINNGIDLASKGGLVWVKCRGAALNNALVDTVRGANQTLFSNSATTNQDYSGSGTINTFSATGFNVGTNALTNATAGAGGTFASWTFREQPKFFDIVTYTGNGANRTIAHNLGSVPGCVIIKSLSAANVWAVYHRSYGASGYGVLNNTDAFSAGADYFNNTNPTSTVFSVGTNINTNESGTTYVAYLFAHNAGGFGLTGTDNVISCGSFTTDGSGNATVNLGYEPQWVMIKSTNIAAPWWMLDTMRGWNQSDDDRFLRANADVAENGGQFGTPTATGFTAQTQFGANNSFVYIAIRRGPMKAPTTGTSVFTPTYGSGTSPNGFITGFPVDMDISFTPAGEANTDMFATHDRLRGARSLYTHSTAAEITSSYDSAGYFQNDLMNRVWNTLGTNWFDYAFRRAPSFMDVVCYTGDGTVNDVAHNLGVVPELIIGKRRNSTGNWAVYCNTFNGGSNPFQYALYLNSTAALTAQGSWFLFDTPTSARIRPTTVFDSIGATYVAYLFATCPGVSKVGSYTGNGSSQTINCGFTGGARFVVIKRTDSTGEWWVWDTVRGMVAGTNPRVAFNSTAAQVNANWVYTTTGGFQIVTTNTDVNASGGTYIYLAIA